MDYEPRICFVRHRGRWGLAGRVLTSSVLLLGVPQTTAAHPSLGDCVQHRVRLTVGPVNMDLEIELTFDDLRSMAERRRMDRDRDRALTRAECGRYAAFLAETLADGMGLAVDGRALELVPLHEPEVDLLGIDQVVPCRHVVRLFFFARTPTSLRAGSEITLIDRLWPEAPAICSLNVAGQEGIRMVAVGADPFSPAVGAGTARLLQARCQVVQAEVVGNRADPLLKSAVINTTGDQAQDALSHARVDDLAYPGYAPSRGLLGLAGALLIVVAIWTRRRMLHPRNQEKKTCDLPCGG